MFPDGDWKTFAAECPAVEGTGVLDADINPDIPRDAMTTPLTSRAANAPISTTETLTFNATERCVRHDRETEVLHFRTLSRQTSAKLMKTS